MQLWQVNGNEKVWYARTVTGMVYTGKADIDFVSNNVAMAFVMGEGEARRKVEVLNRSTALHGFEFVAIQSN